MNVLITKNNQAEAIGKPVTASVAVLLHSTAADSPTGYTVSPTGELGNLLAWETNPQGEDWLKLQHDDGDVRYARFVPGVFYIDPDGENWLKANKLPFWKKPVGMFTTASAGVLLLAALVGIILFNYFKPKKA